MLTRLRLALARWLLPRGWRIQRDDQEIVWEVWSRTGGPIARGFEVPHIYKDGAPDA